MSDDVLAKVLDADDIAARISELGALIARDHHGERPVFVGVLTGSLWFLADLVRAVDLELDVDFLMLNRFGEGGRIRIASDTSVSLSGRDVVLVEDIVDTGLSLTVLRRMLWERQPASLQTVTLLDKVPRRLVEVDIEYRGFEVGDEFLVGYGLDHQGRYRNLPDLWAVLDLAAFSEDPEMLARVALGDT